MTANKQNHAEIGQKSLIRAATSPILLGRSRIDPRTLPDLCAFGSGKWPFGL
jgi:hypothetical protein